MVAKGKLAKKSKNSAKKACFRLAGIVKERAMVISNSLAFPPGTEIEVAWRSGSRITWWPTKARVVGWDWARYRLKVRWPCEGNKTTLLNPSQFRIKHNSKAKLSHGDFRFPKNFKRRHVGHKERMMIAERQNFRCPLCDKKLGRNVSLDHIIPNAVSGDNRNFNLQIVHNQCHKEKTVRDQAITSRRSQIRIV